MSGFQPFLPALKDNVEKVNAAVEAERQRLEEQKRQLEEQEKLLKERQKKAEQQQQQRQQQQAATSTQTSKEIPSAGKSGSKYLLLPPLICFNYYSKYFIKCSTTISKITR